MEEIDLKEEALRWIRSRVGQNEIIQTFADPAKFISENHPVTLFMAGSPGAGKTEMTNDLVRRFDQKPVHIDADEIRARCPGYNGKNSSTFQECANKGVNVLYDHCLDKGYSAVMDGTFSYADAINNIKRSIKRGRVVGIWFVYQDPLQAWKITKQREAVKGRHVPMDVFIAAYFKSQKNVNDAKKEFGDGVKLNFIYRDFESGLRNLVLNVDQVDSHIPNKYTEAELRELLERNP